MAYAAVKTYTQGMTDGRRSVLVTVAETELAAASEYSIDMAGLFGKTTPNWKLVRFKLIETSGTAATYAPVWSNTTAPASTQGGYVGTLSAAASQDSTNTGAGWVGTGATFYGRSVPNAGADNIVTSYLYFVEGWH
jgi:hypothetical protein